MNNKNVKIIVYVAVGILIIVAVIFGIKEQNRRALQNYTAEQIEKLSPEEQKKVWEAQADELQDQIKSLVKGTGEKAEHDYEIAKYKVYIKLAEIQVQLGKHQEALDTLGNIPEGQKSNPAVHRAYAMAYHGLGQDDKALASLKIAVDEGDESSETWLLYLELSKNLPADQLDALYMQALNTTVNTLDVVIAYAKYLESVGDKTKAIIYWETARNINSDGAAEYDREIARLRQ